MTTSTRCGSVPPTARKTAAARSPVSGSSPRPSRSSAPTAQRPSACAPSPPAWAWSPARCTATCAARNSSSTSSWTGCWPRSTPGPTHLLTWTEQVKTLAHRLRAVLEDHPGIAGLLKTRDPLGPHSLVLAEAFLASLQQPACPARQTALAFSLIYDYTLGFALSDRTTVNEQRVHDTATRRRLHAFFRSLPADRFPSLAALGEHVWADNRDQRFTASLDTLLAGIDAARPRQHRQPGH